MEYANLFKKSALELGIKLTEEHISKFNMYLGVLKEWNKKINITGIKDDEDIVIKHFMDSLACLLAIPEYLWVKGYSLIDVGSGGGFPGVPLKIYQENIKLSLIEASHKKCNFLKNLCSLLDIEEVEILVGRAEEYGRESQWRGKYDFVTARAVAELSVVTEYALPFLKVGGMFIAQRGPEVKKEIDSASIAVKVLGGAINDVIEYILETEKETIKRYLVVIEKKTPTPDKYPRRIGVAQKRPIK